MTSALSQAGTELIAIRADNAALRKELATKDARIAEQASAALGMAAVNEMLRKELAEANAVIHTTQDGSLARDQIGIIARANARIATLEAIDENCARCCCAELKAANARIAELERQAERHPPPTTSASAAD